MRLTCVLAVAGLMHEPRRDLRVGQALSDQDAEPLARVRSVRAAPCGCAPVRVGRRANSRTSRARDRWGEQRHHRRRRPGSPCSDLLGRRVLEQEPAGARGERRVHVLVERRTSSAPGRARRPVARIRRDSAGGLDAVEHGHPDVHEQDVRTLAAGQCQPPARRWTPHRRTRCPAAKPELDAAAVAHQRLVVARSRP